MLESSRAAASDLLPPVPDLCLRLAYARCPCSPALHVAVNSLLQRQGRVQQSLKQYTRKAIACPRVLAKVADAGRAMYFAANASDRDAAAALKMADFRHSFLTARAYKIRSGNPAYCDLCKLGQRFSTGMAVGSAVNSSSLKERLAAFGSCSAGAFK